MTNEAAIRELVSQLQLPDQGLQWLAESCFELAVRHGQLELSDWVGAGFPTVGAFRSFLARIASIGRRESNRDLDPYGDRFCIVRSFHNRFENLEIHFSNTMSNHFLSISTVPAIASSNNNSHLSHNDKLEAVVAQ